MGNPNVIRDLVDSRDAQYKQAWRASGIWMSNIAFEDPNAFQKVLETPYMYAWTIIFNKLFRLLVDPRHVDSWKDIAGYATLVVDDLLGHETAGTMAKVVRQGEPQ
jgi:hypothetical protein